MLEFTDAQEMHQNNPDTFDAPTKEELAAVRKGDSVKVCHNNERFWVTVTRVSKKGVITGLVDNDLVCVQPFGYGNRVVFETRHIYSIWSAPKKGEKCNS